MWIKICGVTRTEDAAAVADSGADAIGFNFYSNSKRYVSIPTQHDGRRLMRHALIWLVCL